MSLGDSLKKIFKKDDAPAAATQAAADTASAEAKAVEKPKRPKHGEDGVCCGGCS